MSLVSFALAGASPAARSDLPNGKSDLPGAGDQQLEKQLREQDSARTQRFSAQLRQLFRRSEISNAVASAHVVDASLGAAVSSAEASASAALSNSRGELNAKPHGAGDGGNTGLSHANSALAGARAAINDAKLAALREPEHGDLADLVQLDQQAANAQGTIVINLLV